MAASTETDLAGRSVAVVGGGFGGLSAACYLADRGADVTVLEKNEQLGGRASRLEVDGFRFDMGPSWYLMPDVFERFFGHFGTRPEEYYGLEWLDPHYRIFFKDSTGRTDDPDGLAAPERADRMDVTPDHDQVRAAFEAREMGAAEALDEYLATSERHYETWVVGSWLIVVELRTPRRQTPRLHRVRPGRRKA